MSGNAITWLSTEYSVSPGDDVVAIYYYVGRSMMRRVLLGLAFGLAASCAHAQTAPSPADVGISKGAPDIFKLKGHDNAWTPFGSVDPSTHVFIPGTNGAIAPNDCVKWGPGLTSAGAACNSVTGGATRPIS